MSDPLIGSYVYPLSEGGAPGGGLPAMEVVRCGAIEGVVFYLDRDVWAIRHMGRCWLRAGGWEYEPSPSNRNADFLTGARFTKAEALGAAPEALANLRARYAHYL